MPSESHYPAVWLRDDFALVAFSLVHFFFLYIVFPEIVAISRAEKTRGVDPEKGHQLQAQVRSPGRSLGYSAKNGPAPIISLPLGAGRLGLEAGCGKMAITRSLFPLHLSQAEAV